MSFEALPGASRYQHKALISSEKRRLKTLAGIRDRSSQLIGFLHGPAGSGKTTVVDLVIEYAREYCEELDNYTFTSRTIVVTAMTGVAATLLSGETTHAALYLNRKTELSYEQIENFEDTRLVIIDEISFACDISKIDKYLRTLKQKSDNKFGDCHIVFAGDLRQLEPVGSMKKPLHEDTCPEFSQWIKCYLELEGMHRLKNDNAWGLLLKRVRDGAVTKADIEKINERVEIDESQFPSNMRYATYQNKDRDAINTALFEKRCCERQERVGNINDSILIFCDNLMIQNGEQQYVEFKARKLFWEQCSENDISTGRHGRLDPVLKLYHGCRVMLTKNEDVKSGKANGTQLIIEKVVLKNDVHPRKIEFAKCLVNAVSFCDVQHIVVKHCNDRIRPQRFNITASSRSITAIIPLPQNLQTGDHDDELVKMKADKVPITVNNATTGHKLQGFGVDNLFGYSWY